MKKAIVTLGIVGVLAALSLPLSNLLTPPDPKVEAMVSKIPDAHFKKAATVFAHKCLDCHSSYAQIPFYAKLPVANKLIIEDMEDGLAHFDLSDKLYGEGQGFTALDLARLEKVLKNNSMPLPKYVALHWNTALNRDDKAALKTWIQDRRAAMGKAVGMAPSMWQEPFTPLPEPESLHRNEPDYPAKVALGDKLYHDVRLSGDNTISCASCHDLKHAGVDHKRTSTGIRGQQGPINGPTVFNAVFNASQFWDGRAATLKEQAAGPVHNPLEMGSNWKQLVGKLSRDPAMVHAFNRLYPNGLTGDNIADAIATFETSLITPNAPFDRYLRGDQNALTASAKHGYQLFKANCAFCHVGANLGGQSYARINRRADYFADRPHPLTAADNGRFNVTGRKEDMHKFRVPSLRNVAVTAPYMHDGYTTTLSGAVRVMAKYEVGRQFTDTEVNDLVAFLESLTGEYKGKPLQP